MDEDDDRANALATEIMAIATVRELRDSADEIAELLIDPPPLPTLEGFSVLQIFRRLQVEHETNQRLRSRLRQMVAD